MSRSSDKADQRKVESPNWMSAEPQPGPSRCHPSRQGYCGYCRVLYTNLDQHLSSLKHLDSVQSSSRGSSTASSSSSKTKLTLLERFLQDVLTHHPHNYKDTRPSHADLPAVSSPLLPREELDELCVSEKDTQSLGTREHLPSSDNASNQPANQQEDASSRSQSGQGEGDGGHPAPIKELKEEESKGAQAAPITQAPPPLHRKAHRKTDRRKNSSSSSASFPRRVPDTRPPVCLNPVPPSKLKPTGPGPPSKLKPTGPGPPSKLKPTGPGPPSKLKPTGPGPPSELQPWLSWQKTRRETLKEEAFSSDPVDQTIEEVIQMCCYGVTSAPGHQEETESFHLSIPVSMETSSDDWDSPVQPAHTPVQVSHTPSQRDLTRLMDSQVELEDQVYSYQLDFALHSEQEGGGAKRDHGFWTLPIDEILPAPEHIPESFRGKTWAQVEQEDEHRVEQLVRQFRGEKFLCYFDSESLARYGKRSRKKEQVEAEPHSDFLPLLEHVQEDTAHVRRRKRRGFRVASRCQVVKVSHGTQTIRLVVPAVCPPASEAPPTSLRAANEEAAERTPKAQTWRSLPSSYSSVITPLQPRTSVVYLLSCPPGPAPSDAPADSASKRCRKKRRPLGSQRAKVKYKRFPVRFYEPTSNRILKNPPKGVLWHRGSAPSSLPPPCVRQLFRSLSPDLNSDRLPEEGDAGSSRVKGHISLLSVLSKGPAQPDKQGAVRGRGRTSLVPLSPTHSRSERGRGGRRNRTRPQTFKRRTRAQATPPHPRREGLRRTGPIQTPPPPPSQQGRGRRGRGLERTRR